MNPRAEINEMKNQCESNKALIFGPVRISEEKKIIIEKELIIWGEKNYIDFPWRKTENKYHSLIAELMLQRTRAEQVVPVYFSFTKKYKTCTELANEDSESILMLLKPLGLTWRSKKIIDLSKKLDQKNGIIPDTKAELLELPGIGDYIANAYLSLYRNIKASIIDINAVRLWSRLFSFPIKKETHRSKWFIEFTDYITPIFKFKEFNLSVLDLTRSICNKTPKCVICPINESCMYYLGYNKKIN